MKYLIIVMLCLLIVSCDFPNEDQNIQCKNYCLSKGMDFGRVETIQTGGSRCQCETYMKEINTNEQEVTII